MELEYWVLKSSALCSSDSGYENTFTNIKETVRLEKKDQKLLRKLFHSTRPIIQLQKVQNSSLKQFQIETLPPRPVSKQCNISYLPWPKVEIKNKLQNLDYQKEKLKLDDGSKRLFIWLTNLPSSQIQHEPFAKCRNQLQGTERFKVDFEFLSSCDNRFSKTKKYEAMPSISETRFKETLKESIPKTVTFSFGEKLRIEHHFCKTIALKNYILEIAKPPVLSSTTVKFLRWPLPSTCQNEVVFEMLRSQLFDLEFNKLEFFKMNIDCTQCNKNSKNKLPNKWKMSKLELKLLDWNPFKQIGITTTSEITSIEKIAACTFSPPTFELEFQKLSYNSFDFINLEEKTFGCLKFGSASRPAPRMTKEHSVSLDKEEAPDSAIESEHHNTSMIPQKRSFIDDDLLSILHSRKKSRKYDDDNTSATFHGATMFRIVDQKINRHQKIRSSPVSTALEPLKTPQILFEPARNPRRILVNATKIKENHRIIQYLSNKTNLQLVEQDLPFKCDFIIDPTSCIFIAQLDLFFQLQADNTMFYEHIFKSLHSEFKTVVILLKYPEILDTADRDVFWKIRLFLQPPDFQLFLTKETPQGIGKWIDMLSNNPRDDQPPDSHPFLLLHLNKFLVQKLLSRYTLEQILLMSTTEESKELSDLLTGTQLKRIQKLMSLGW